MIHDVLSWAGVISLLVTVVVVLGASFRASRNTTSMANYRDAAQSWESRASSQAAELTELRQAVVALTADKDRLTGELRSLRDLVTGRAELAELRDQVQASFAAMEDRIIGKDAFATWQEEIRIGITQVLARLSQEGRPA